MEGDAGGGEGEEEGVGDGEGHGWGEGERVDRGRRERGGDASEDPRGGTHAGELLPWLLLP